jgi:hypothetical protein
MTRLFELTARLKPRPFKSLFFILSNHQHLSNLQNLVKCLEGGFLDQVVDSVGEIVRAIMSLSDYAV